MENTNNKTINTTTTNNTPATPAKVATTAMAKYVTLFTGIIERMGLDNGLNFSKSQKINVSFGCQQIFKICSDNNMSYKDLDQSNVSQALYSLALLDLNPCASPRQCYFTLRKNNVKTKDGYIVKPTIELGIEGDGNDTLVRKYGVDVKSLSAPYIVREGDAFTLPQFDGEGMVAPTWKPTSLTGKALYVFYILKKTDGSVEYPIASREGVVTNLIAHINNNMNGVDDKTKEAILKKIEGKSLEQILNDESLRHVKYKKYNAFKKSYEEDEKTLISPAWTSLHSREEMIIRKMRNNCLKKYPKNFDNAFITEAYESTFENAPKINPVDAIDAEYDLKNNSESISSAIPFNAEVDADTGEIKTTEKTTEKVTEKKNEPLEEAQPQSNSSDVIVTDDLPY